MRTRLIIADTETTGLTDPIRVCEIAWTEIDYDFNVLGSFISLVDPQQPISFGAMGVHGITNEAVANSPTMDELFFEVLDNPLQGEVILIGHNVKFDKLLTEKYIPGLQLAVCTMRMAQRYLPDAENHKLSTLRFQYGLTGGTSHRADGDVLTTLSLLQFLSSLSGKSLAELIEESPEPVLIKTMAFGKHRGDLITSIPNSYIDWMLGPKGIPDLGFDLSYSLKKARGLL